MSLFVNSTSFLEFDRSDNTSNNYLIDDFFFPNYSRLRLKGTVTTIAAAGMTLPICVKDSKFSYLDNTVCQMTMDAPDFIAQTNYFNHSRTWYFRAFQFSVAVFVLYLVDLYEMPNGLSLLYLCSVPLAILFIVLPVDDLAINNEAIYFTRRSILSVLNSTTTYQISYIKRVGFASMSRAPSVFSLFVPIPSVYRIEFTFQDSSSKSNDIFISKKDLQRIVAELRRIQKS